MEHVEELRRLGAEACLGRLWTHTVGIANNIRDVGFHPNYKSDVATKRPCVQAEVYGPRTVGDRGLKLRKVKR